MMISRIICFLAGMVTGAILVALMVLSTVDVVI